MTKQNNAAVLIFSTDANFKNPSWIRLPLHSFKFRKKDCSIVSKRLFLQKFSKFSQKNFIKKETLT